MKPKAIVKIVIDICMTILLMLLMAFELIGRSAHEWIGAGIFILFIVHHVLNCSWSRKLFAAKYTPMRILQTVLAALVLISMIGSMVSAVIISREVFAFMEISGGSGFARTLHMLSAYWGFIFLSLHLGLHWGMMMKLAGRSFKKSSRQRDIIMKAVGACIAIYGIYAFIIRQIPSYLFLQTQFVFFDFEEPLILFFIDYIAIMGLFVFIGHYLSKLMMHIQKRRNSK